ncbi:MAG: hypothetical protein J7L73_09730 [Anaerolineales bacterium]|nr:hypothetical protein [Anaerolineales bacterium]
MISKWNQINLTSRYIFLTVMAIWIGLFVYKGWIRVTRLLKIIRNERRKAISAKQEDFSEQINAENVKQLNTIVPVKNLAASSNKPQGKLSCLPEEIRCLFSEYESVLCPALKEKRVFWRLSLSYIQCKKGKNFVTIGELLPWPNLVVVVDKKSKHVKILFFGIVIARWESLYKFIESHKME